MHGRIRAMAMSALLLVPALALAEPEGPLARGRLVLGVNRLLPLVAYSSIRENNASGSGSTTTTVTSIAVFGNPFSILQDFYNVPRLGLDYAVTDFLTVGADLFFYTMLAASRSSSAGTNTDTDKLTIYGLFPRVGFALPISRSVTLWPRLGLTYAAATDSPPGNAPSSASHQLAVSLEPMFLFSPVEHVALALGLAFDVPLSGSVSAGSQSVDMAQLHIGLTGGLDVWF